MAAGSSWGIYLSSVETVGWVLISAQGEAFPGQLLAAMLEERLSLVVSAFCEELSLCNSVSTGGGTRLWGMTSVRSGGQGVFPGAPSKLCEGAVSWGASPQPLDSSP